MIEYKIFEYNHVTGEGNFLSSVYADDIDSAYEKARQWLHNMNLPIDFLITVRQ